MKIEINTSPKDVESANCILGFAIDAFKKPANLKNYGLTKAHVKQAEKFRAALVKAFLKGIKK